MRLVSTSLHSKFAKHSPISGALTLSPGHGGEPELGKLVDVAAGAVADADDLRADVHGGHVDHALLALADHVEAVVLGPDVAADQRGLELHDHVPAHGHDVGLALPRGAHQHDRTGLEEAADVIGREILFDDSPASLHPTCQFRDRAEESQTRGIYQNRAKTTFRFRVRLPRPGSRRIGEAQTKRSAIRCADFSSGYEITSPLSAIPTAHSANANAIATSSRRLKRPDAPPWPAPMLVRSSTGPPPVMVARNRAIHLAGSQ